MENFKQGTAHVNLAEYMELLKMKEAVMNGKQLVIHSRSDIFSSSESFIYFTESEMLESMMEINRDFLTNTFHLKQDIKKLEKDKEQMIKDIKILKGNPVQEEESEIKDFTNFLPKTSLKKVLDIGKVNFAKNLSFWEFIKLKYFNN